MIIGCDNSQPSKASPVVPFGRALTYNRKIVMISQPGRVGAAWTVSFTHYELVSILYRVTRMEQMGVFKVGAERAMLPDAVPPLSATMPADGVSGMASPQAIAEVMMHIGHVADSLGYTQGLKPSQWTALRYFAGANPSQRTVSAFADFHATTRGAASQMVEVLVGKELLARVPVPEDRRVTHLHPTPKALELLRHDPLNEFAGIVAALPSGDQYHLADTLTKLLRGLLAKRQAA